jgi:hypothetical protein
MAVVAEVGSLAHHIMTSWYSSAVSPVVRSETISNPA